MKRAFSFIALALIALSLESGLAADFKASDLEGKVHQLSRYKGRWVVVNFWATWCTPCVAEMPEFDAAWQARKSKDLVVLGVALDYDTPNDVQEFVQKHPVHYPIILGNDDLVNAIAGKKGVPALPTTVIFDPEGKERYSGTGKMTREKIESLTH